MREFGTIHSAYWSSTAINSWTDDAKLLGAYLMTCSHGTIAGICPLPDGYVAEDLKWGFERVREGFHQLSIKQFAERCETTNWVWIRKFLEWNAPDNPNQWKAVRKAAGQIPEQCAWRVDFYDLLSVLTGEKVKFLPNPSETVTEPLRNLIPSQPIPTQQEQQSEREPAHAIVPRGTGLIQMGSAGTTISPSAAYDSLMEDWRRDVPECSPDAFQKWIVSLESMGKPMSVAMRLGQARLLAGNGGFPEQLEVVEFCIAQGYRSLIPLASVRERTRGKAAQSESRQPTRTWRPPPDEPGAKAC